MSRNKTILAVLVVCLSLNFLPLTYAVAKIEIKTPTIIEIIQSGEYKNQPLIIGQAPHNTEVLVYLNNVFVSLAEIKGQDEVSDFFSWQVQEILKPGQYRVIAVARDKTSLVLSAPSAVATININALPAPTLVQPDELTITGKTKPAITGLTVNASFVRIYIDGVYNGKTAFLEHVSGTANFAYKPFLDLAVGDHFWSAVAEDKLGQVSGMSEIIHFRVSEPTPAPTLFKVKANIQAVNKPLITGLAKNNSLIKVFIDNTLNGQFVVKNDVSGTANFAYSPYLDLTKGQHFVYTVAYDTGYGEKAKESLKSNIQNFIVGSVMTPKITPVAVEEKPAVVITPEPIKEPTKPKPAKPTEDNSYKTKPETVKPVEDKTKKTEETKPIIKDQDVKNILNSPQSTTTSTSSGVINESKNLQSKLNLNLAIFILFLVAVMGWIFWVNRELIKEKREQEQELKEKKD